MALRPTGMQSETHRLLVKAVGQKHNKVAKLRLVADPTVDPEREKLELMKQNAKKSKSKRAAHDEFGYGRKKRRRARSTDRGDIYTDDEEETGMYAGEDEEDDDIGRASLPGNRSGKPEKMRQKNIRQTTLSFQTNPTMTMVLGNTAKRKRETTVLRRTILRKWKRNWKSRPLLTGKLAATMVKNRRKLQTKT
jgi:hypothetical protein